MSGCVRLSDGSRSLHHPPLLCIEILSPSDTVEGMRERIHDYLNMGIPQVWLLAPKIANCDRLCQGNTMVEPTSLASLVCARRLQSASLIAQNLQRSRDQARICLALKRERGREALPNHGPPSYFAFAGMEAISIISTVVTLPSTCDSGKKLFHFHSHHYNRQL